MRVLYIMGAFYLTALFLLWAGRCGKVSRKLTVLLSAVCLLAGSVALAAAVYPAGNGYGKTVNRLQDLPGNGAVSAPSPGGAAQKPAPGSGKTASSVTAAGGRIALTFDDGPYLPYTERLLDVLKEKKAHATFFLVAEQAQRHPELVKRMAAEGHTIGLHAYRHRDFLKLSAEEKTKELTLGKKTLLGITGKEPVFWRPPHGFRDFSVTEAAVTNMLTVVNWSVIPRDWTGIDGQEIYNRIMDKAEDGAIVLLHDGDAPSYKASRQATVEATVLLIDSLRGKGYHLVSLEEELARKKAAK